VRTNAHGRGATMSEQTEAAEAAGLTSSLAADCLWSPLPLTQRQIGFPQAPQIPAFLLSLNPACLRTPLEAEEPSAFTSSSYTFSVLTAMGNARVIRARS